LAKSSRHTLLSVQWMFTGLGKVVGAEATAFVGGTAQFQHLQRRRRRGGRCRPNVCRQAGAEFQLPSAAGVREPSQRRESGCTADAQAAVAAEPATGVRSHRQRTPGWVRSTSSAILQCLLSSVRLGLSQTPDCSKNTSELVCFNRLLTAHSSCPRACDSVTLK